MGITRGSAASPIVRDFPPAWIHSHVECALFFFVDEDDVDGIAEGGSGLFDAVLHALDLLHVVLGALSGRMEKDLGLDVNVGGTSSVYVIRAACKFSFHG